MRKNAQLVQLLRSHVSRFRALGSQRIWFLGKLKKFLERLRDKTLNVPLTEREQLSSVHPGTSETYHLPIVLLRQIFARMQTDAYGFETWKYPLCFFGLGSVLQPQETKRYPTSQKYRSSLDWFWLSYFWLGASLQSCLHSALQSSWSDIRTRMVSTLRCLVRWMHYVWVVPWIHAFPNAWQSWTSSHDGKNTRTHSRQVIMILHSSWLFWISGSKIWSQGHFAPSLLLKLTEMLTSALKIVNGFWIRKIRKVTRNVNDHNWTCNYSAFFSDSFVEQKPSSLMAATWYGMKTVLRENMSETTANPFK